MEEKKSLSQQFEEKLINLVEESSPDQLIFALQILQKLFDNIISNPNEEKFRNIRTTVQQLKEKLFIIPGIDQLILRAGYTYNAQTATYTISGDAYNNLYAFQLFIKEQINVLTALLSGNENEVEIQQNHIQRRKSLQQESKEQQAAKQKIVDQGKIDRIDQAQDIKFTKKPEKLTFGAKIVSCQEDKEGG